MSFRLKTHFAVAALAVLSLPVFAATPKGKFQCRRYPPQTSTSPYGDPVAYIWLRPHGEYDLLDLTTTKGKVSGQYVYDKKKHEIDWTTGDLGQYIGHYAPYLEATKAVRLNTKKDPEGHVDGTMWCVHMPND